MHKDVYFGRSLLHFFEKCGEFAVGTRPKADKVDACDERFGVVSGQSPDQSGINGCRNRDPWVGIECIPDLRWDAVQFEPRGQDFGAVARIRAVEVAMCDVANLIARDPRERKRCPTAEGEPSGHNAGAVDVACETRIVL